MIIPPNSPLFPLQAVASTDGGEVTVAFGYWQDGKPMARFAAQLPPSFTDEEVQSALNRFQALANRVDTLTDGWKPRVIGNVVSGDFGRVN